MKEATLKAAREIQSQLSELLSEENAKQVHSELDKLLQRADMGEDVTTEIQDLLGDYPTTQQWLKVWYQNNETGDFETKGYSPLAGDHTPPKPKGTPDDPEP